MSTMIAGYDSDPPALSYWIEYELTPIVMKKLERIKKGYE